MPAQLSKDRKAKESIEKSYDCCRNLMYNSSFTPCRTMANQVLLRRQTLRVNHPVKLQEDGFEPARTSSLLWSSFTEPTVRFAWTVQVQVRSEPRFEPSSLNAPLATAKFHGSSMFELLNPRLQIAQRISYVGKRYHSLAFIDLSELSFHLQSQEKAKLSHHDSSPTTLNSLTA